MPGESGEGLTFETLSERRRERMAAQSERGRRGPPQVSRSDLNRRQQMLDRDLDKAGNALDAEADQVSKAMDQVRQAAGKPGDLASKLSAPEMQRRLSMADRMNNGQPNRPGQSRFPGGIPAEQLLGRALGKIEPHSANSTDLANNLAGLNLLPRDREELLQGAAKKPPPSYSGFVRDYYNRLSEVKPKK
jgi:hypothetical protein